MQDKIISFIRLSLLEGDYFAAILAAKTYRNLWNESHPEFLRILVGASSLIAGEIARDSLVYEISNSN